MYRDYLDPRSLETTLEEMRAEYGHLLRTGADVCELQDLALSIDAMEQDVASAWEDEEFDMEDDWF